MIKGSFVSIPCRVFCAFLLIWIQQSFLLIRVSIPCRVFCAFLQAQPKPLVVPGRRFNPLQGFLCISTRARRSKWKSCGPFQSLAGFSVHFYAQIIVLPFGTLEVSIPCRVFCAFLQAQTLLQDKALTGFNPLQGFLCISTLALASWPGPRCRRFNPLQGFLCISTGDAMSDPVLINRFNPLQGFLCISTWAPAGYPAPYVRFQSLAGFSVHFYPCHARRAILFLGFQSLAGFSVHFYRTADFASCRCRRCFNPLQGFLCISTPIVNLVPVVLALVSIPCRVFCAFLLSGLYPNFHCVSSFNPLQGFLCISTSRRYQDAMTQSVVSIPCRVFCAFLLTLFFLRGKNYETFQSLAGFSVHFYPKGKRLNESLVKVSIPCRVFCAFLRSK